MDSEAAFKNIWIPRRKPDEKDAATANGSSSVPAAEVAAEELEQFRQIEGQDDSGDSEDDEFAAAMKSISGTLRGKESAPVCTLPDLPVAESQLSLIDHLTAVSPSMLGVGNRITSAEFLPQKCL